jgi:HEAT repeat protein
MGRFHIRPEDKGWLLIAPVVIGLLALVLWVSREPPPAPRPDPGEQHRLLADLQAEDAKVRARGAEALGEYQVLPILPETLRALAKALRDPDVQVRAAAAKALVKVAPQRVKQDHSLADELVPALAAAAGDAGPRVRHTVLTALAEIGPLAREAAPALSERLKIATGAERMAAAWALALVDDRRLPEAVAVLKAGLRDSAADVRTSAAQELKKVGSPAKAAAADLLQAVKSDAEEPLVRVEAAWALLKIDPGEARKAAPALRDLIEDIDRRTNGKYKITPKMWDVRHDPLCSVRNLAVNALRRIEP